MPIRGDRMDKETERTEFILTCVLYLSIAILGLFISFWSFTYPSAEDLVYKECTFIRHEDLKRKNGKLCYIYVEEYEKPLEISGVTKSHSDHDYMSNIQRGDTIYICVAKEGRLSYFLCYLSHNENVILSHDGYLAGHNENDHVRIALGWIMFVLSTAVIIYQGAVYRKFSKITPIHSRFSPNRPTTKDVAREIKSFIRKWMPKH